MRIQIYAALTLLLAPVSISARPAPPTHQSDRRLEYAREKVYPALVNITVVMRFFEGGRAHRAPAGGSGVIVTPEGHVLTNYHVAGNTTRIMCTLATGETIEAKVIAHDPPTDLSVLKLRTDRRPKGSRPLPFAKLGDSDLLQIGEPVIAMGNPLMLSSSLTLGVVSNAHRVFTDFIGTQMADQELDDEEETGMFTRWIQHDALILPGNSGGPLVNLQGEVIGINELGGNGMGFAIPSNTAAHILRSALAHGAIRRGWLGITLLPVNKMGRTSGALVSSVQPGSPAQKAQIKPGDVILSIGGESSNVRFFEELPPVYQRIADLAIGSSVPIRYLRDEQLHTAMLTVVKMEPSVGEEAEIRELGMTVRNITDGMALAHQLSTRNGVLVTGVRPGFPGDTATPKVAEGDVVTAVGGKPTPNVSAIRKIAAALGTNDTSITFRRMDEDIVATVKINADQTADEGGELPKAWIGVKTQVVTPELAKALNHPEVKGFRVTEVYADTDAQKAGLRTGDILTSINGTALEASRPQDSEDLRHAVEELNVGEQAKIGILRGGSTQLVSVKLQPTPTSAAQAKKQTQEDFEFTVREISALDRMERRWKADQKGLLVSDVTAGGWAQMAGLHPDDIILAIQAAPIESLDSFQSAMKLVLKRRPRVIDIFVQRGFTTHFVFIEPDWDKLTTKP